MSVTISGDTGLAGAATGALNGSLGATTPSTVVATDLTTTGNTTLGDASTDTLNVGNGDLIKDASGNVGIGVTPSAWGGGGSIKAMQVKAASIYEYGGYESGYMINTFFDGAFKYIGTAAASKYVQSSGSHAWYTAPSGTAGNAITFTQAMTLDASGNLLVGTIAQINDGKICSQFNGDTTNGLILKTTRTAINSTYIAFVNSAGAFAGSVIHNGTTTVNYSTSSDYRLKENVAPMTGALEKIALLKPVTYTWKNTDDELGEGFIAHELQEVCPLAVSGEKDAVNEDGSIKAQGIDTSFLVATLTAAIQELNAKFEEYKASHP